MFIKFIHIQHTVVGCLYKCLLVHLYMCVLKRNSLVHVFSFFSRNSLNHMAFMVSKLEEEDSFSSCASLARFFSKNYFTPHSHIDSFFLYFCQPPTTILALRSAYESFHIRRCGAGFGSLTGLAGMSRHCRMRNGQVHFWCQKWNSFYFFIVRFFSRSYRNGILHDVSFRARSRDIISKLWWTTTWRKKNKFSLMPLDII